MVLDQKAGLSEKEALARLKEHGLNVLARHKRLSVVTLLLRQFTSPLILILLGAAILSLILYQKIDAWIILTIVVASGLLGFWQEGRAFRAMEKIVRIVRSTTGVIRGGHLKEVQIETIVPGDVVVLKAGDIIPADMSILESKDLFVDESPLTGEAFAIEKKDELFMGCHVISGTAIGIVVKTGKGTKLGQITGHLKERKGETTFEKEIREFGKFLMKVTALILFCALGFNIVIHGAILNSVLFALALAVGLTPQLLPAIVSVNLARGARKMAHLSVVVKRLVAIENFGNMTTLCVDKTGTITEGFVRIDSFIDANEESYEKIMQYAYINSFFQTGYTNPIDHAICTHNKIDCTEYEKLDEIPYDFFRKRLSILVRTKTENLMVCKGAFESVLPLCKDVEIKSGHKTALIRKELEEVFQKMSSQGFRLLGVAYKTFPDQQTISKEDEKEMTFLGFLVLGDHLKKGIILTMNQLRKLGVSLRIITGDNVYVTSYIAKSIGLEAPVVTGRELFQYSDEELKKKLGEMEVFAEIEPYQKERIVRLLRENKQIVGFLGDGINDALAMQGADVSISVNRAVDVAKEEADIVLLHKDLSVLVKGIKEGRQIFANTLKYIFMATSANFGNMFSMAGASLFLPFLPLLPKQILMTNLLTDIPEMTIGTDEVDKELVDSPVRLDIKFISHFMIVFGCISSLFDYTTFLILYLLDATKEQFWTGWFIESVVSAALIVLIIRTRRPFYQSKPSNYLIASTVSIIVFTLFIPSFPFAGLMNFTPLPGIFYAAIAGILVCYVLSVEFAKKLFFSKRV